MEDSQPDEIIPAAAITIPPSVDEHRDPLLRGHSYVHLTKVPTAVTPTQLGDDTTDSIVGTPCVLGVDEAGRGPVIGPMVYGALYLPLDLQHSLLADTHHFDDSKVLTPIVRARLMRDLCTDSTDLFKNCGWAIKSLSAQDISAGMLKNGGSYNLNAQAMDATVEIIRGVLQLGVNVTEIYIDTIGSPVVYQKKLERIFPTIRITVEKKADSLYPCVSAASVVAKVTRDVSCEVLYEQYAMEHAMENTEGQVPGWGSGYPSDARCTSWLKSAIEPTFGWGSECRFSWGTIKDLLDAKDNESLKIDWPTDSDDDNMRVSQYFSTQVAAPGSRSQHQELIDWYGTSVGQEAF